MKKTEIPEPIEAFYCDLCGEKLEEKGGDDWFEVNVSLHLHRKCEDRLPTVARGEDWFFTAVEESGTKVGMTLENFLPEDPLVNEDFLLFVNSEEDGAWMCQCNNLKAVGSIWTGFSEGRWIEAVWHKGKFHRAKFEVVTKLEEV